MQSVIRDDEQIMGLYEFKSITPIYICKALMKPTKNSDCADPKLNLTPSILKYPREVADDKRFLLL